ncbi:hypothetical protein [Leisingera daeponensis]|uniref:hypothetical protein n=1 Tax=Leisingera daeponensis TaxID=405746 RepID=UPI001C9823D0|nr:hypothetical protein [Leisingera daeponensis]MBY6057086.1 hypothetical protein [Leisingera daeponensis]
MEKRIVGVTGLTYRRIGLRRLRSALHLTLVLLLSAILMASAGSNRTVGAEHSMPGYSHVQAFAADYGQQESIQHDQNLYSVPASLGDCELHALCHALALLPIFLMPEWKPEMSVAVLNIRLLADGIALSPSPHPPNFS